MRLHRRPAEAPSSRRGGGLVLKLPRVLAHGDPAMSVMYVEKAPGEKAIPLMFPE
jgi:hypothetical protein